MREINDVRNFQREKNLVLEHYSALSQATTTSVSEILAKRTTPDWYWRGMHPFNEQNGAGSVARAFWEPYLAAMSRVQRRQDIFMAGLNEIDGFQSVWVVSMGHLMGLFDEPFLGIHPTRRIAMLRYAEFNRVEGGRIAETALFCDIIHLMMQSGQSPLPPQTGAHMVQPGPMTHDGLMYGPQNATRGTETLGAINAMLKDMREENHIAEEQLARTWNTDMIWWGPGGIGATYTIPRYREQHAGPFRQALARGYKFNGHLCRLAEGSFGGFFGWPNLTVSNAGGYLGMTASPRPGDMRVVDIYRAENGKLSENWIFIDVLHFLNMQGLDVLGRMRTLGSRGIAL
jgi:hypothetical protein